MVHLQSITSIIYGQPSKSTASMHHTPLLLSNKGKTCSHVRHPCAQNPVRLLPFVHAQLGSEILMTLHESALTLTSCVCTTSGRNKGLCHLEEARAVQVERLCWDDPAAAWVLRQPPRHIQHHACATQVSISVYCHYSHYNYLESLGSQLRLIGLLAISCYLTTFRVPSQCSRGCRWGMCAGNCHRGAVQTYLHRQSMLPHPACDPFAC